MTGVLLMAHGTPDSLDEMPEYLRIVRGGRPPSDELVAEMPLQPRNKRRGASLVDADPANPEPLREHLDDEVGNRIVIDERAALGRASRMP